MVSPILTPALAALRRGFDVASPNRDRGTDGWIGDAAHQAEVSGHNPDDTPGVRAEYSDTDSIPEVRAIDVDDDLRATFTMHDVIALILLTPKDLARLRYIIYDRTIWSRSNNWAPKAYTGPDPHVSHAHFSGDPLTDNDSSPWSVEDIAVASQFSAEDIAALRSAALAVLQYNGRGIGDNDSTTADNKSMLAYFDEILRAGRTSLVDLASMKTELANMASDMEAVKVLLQNGSGGTGVTLEQVRQLINETRLTAE